MVIAFGVFDLHLPGCRGLKEKRMIVKSLKTRIRNEFGKVAFLRVVLMIIALIALPAIGYFGFSSFLPAAIIIVGSVIGFLLRRQVVDHFEWFRWALPSALFIYGVVLFIGERIIGMSKLTQLVTITAVTVIVFNIQFWALSDPSIIYSEDE